MDKYKKLGDYLKQNAAGVQMLPLFNADVVSVEGESCTIDIDGLHIDEVRLKATINGNTNKIIITPAVGSTVLVGSLTGDLKDLAVVSVDEVEKLEYLQSGLHIVIDSSDGKMEVSNNAVSLKNIFQSLADLIRQLKVFTPVGPSGTPLPDTITRVSNFETDFKSILK